MIISDPFNILRGKKTYKGDPPGTVVYTGEHSGVKTKIECLVYNRESLRQKAIENIEPPFDKAYTYWFNIVGLNDIDTIKSIGQIFDIHHMDLEDIVHVSQWSKIEKKHHYLFGILKMIYQEDKKIVHEHLAILHKDNVIVTFQETPGDVFDEVRSRISKMHGRIREKGSDYLFYTLLDALIDEYFPIINRISSDFKDLELKILDNDLSGKEELYKLRKELVYLINSTAPIKDAVKSLVTSTASDPDQKELAPYYGDLLEHINQILESLNAYKEMTKSLHEMHMSNVSNDMNEIMMTLTIFSAIFIPLSFLAGVFGMNFSHIPGLDVHFAFYIFIAVCFITAAGMLLFFKHKKWY